MSKKSLLRILAVTSIVSMIAIGCAKEEGDDSITSLPRDKFIGTWHVTAVGTNSGTQSWDLIIEPASASVPEMITMKNFDQVGNNYPVNADVSGNNLLIPGQTAGAVSVEGTGNLNGATLTLDYTSTDSQVDSVHATAIK